MAEIVVATLGEEAFRTVERTPRQSLRFDRDFLDFDFNSLQKLSRNKKRTQRF